MEPTVLLSRRSLAMAYAKASHLPLQRSRPQPGLPPYLSLDRLHNPRLHLRSRLPARRAGRSAHHLRSPGRTGLADLAPVSFPQRVPKAHHRRAGPPAKSRLNSTSPAPPRPRIAVCITRLTPNLPRHSAIVSTTPCAHNSSLPSSPSCSHIPPRKPLRPNLPPLPHPCS
jgi:hypothetical protein